MTKKAVRDNRLTPFQFQNYQQIFKGTIKNNGHSGQPLFPSAPSLKKKKEKSPRCCGAEFFTCASDPVQVGVPHLSIISGGGLSTSYKAVQFHLHWGHDGGPGSEHTIDGEQYPMEVPPAAAMPEIPLWR